MPNQFLSDEFGDIEDYFVTDYWLIDNFVGDQLWVWGDNNVGQLGTNDATTRSIPVTTFAGGTTWKQISVAAINSNTGKMAAIKTDGTLWTWGWGGEGALGNFANTNRSTPVTTFIGGNTWKQVSAGGLNVAAIKTDGTLWAWGSNGSFGALGINASGDRNTPVTTFAGGTNWKQVSCGNNFTAAIKTDGSLWTWGAGSDFACLGINNAVIRNTPVTTFAGGNDWKQVSCGRSFVAAVKTDGSLWTWGRNDLGQLGVNDTATRSTPVTTIVGGNNWKSVNASSTNLGATGAIKTDGTLWVWGSASVLGIRVNFPNKLTPVTTFSGGTNWKQIAMGRTTMAIKTDGTLWETNNDFTTFVPTFGGGNNWKSVSSGGENTAFIGAIKSGLNVDLS